MSKRELNVWPLPRPDDEDRLASSTVVVIDVLRASSTICQALASGATEVVPLLEVEDALAEAARAEDRSRVVLGGERGGRRINGFDLGNSPAEYTPEAVAGCRVLLTTTNGTRAIDHARRGARVLVGALVNRAAVVGAVRQAPRVDILCAGTDGQETREDILAAGAIVDQLLTQEAPDWRTNAAAIAAVQDWRAVIAAAEAAGRPLSQQLAIELRTTRGGRNLLAIGMEDDIAACAQLDSLAVVPELDAASGRIAG